MEEEKRYSKGIWEQLQDNQIKYSSSKPFDFRKAFEVICEEARKPRKYKMQFIAYGYEGWSDEQFRIICAFGNSKYYNVTFIGGLEGITAFRERCNRLGIKY